MILLAAGVLLVAFLLYGALLVSRFRAEDPGEWPQARLADGRATLRLHPGWTERPVGSTEPAPAGEPASEVRRVRTGIPGGDLVIEVHPAAGPVRPSPAPNANPESSAGAASRLASLPSREGVTLDAPVVTPFLAGPHPGARLASAGSDSAGGRGWFEWHLVTGPDSTVLFRYRCPVLSGSRESLPLARCVESLRFSAPPESSPCAETSGAFGQ